MWCDVMWCDVMCVCVCVCVWTCVSTYPCECRADRGLKRRQLAGNWPQTGQQAPGGTMPWQCAGLSAGHSTREQLAVCALEPATMVRDTVVHSVSKVHGTVVNSISMVHNKAIHSRSMVHDIVCSMSNVHDTVACSISMVYDTAARSISMVHNTVLHSISMVHDTVVCSISNRKGLSWALNSEEQQDSRDLREMNFRQKEEWNIWCIDKWLLRLG